MTSPNKVALITAASRGMGAAIARRLSEDGYRLALMSRSDDVMALANELGGIGFKGSTDSAADLEAIVAAALDTYDRIDAVVCNTGHPPKGDLLSVTDQEWHDGFDLAFLHQVRLARLVTPQMERQGSGVIVGISAFGAVDPSLRFPVSSAIRAGLGAFVRLYAERYGPAGIRMNSVLPGFIETYEIDEETRARIPLHRAGRVAEVAATVSFLVSDGGAYITGQNIRLDGGLTRSI